MASMRMPTSFLHSPRKSSCGIFDVTLPNSPAPQATRSQASRAAFIASNLQPLILKYFFSFRKALMD
jgi:hypothetical protein